MARFDVAVASTPQWVLPGSITKAFPVILHIYRYAFGLILALGLGSVAIQAADELPVPLQTDRDKASYGLGLSIASDLKRAGLEVNLQALLAGMEDAMGDKEPRVSQAEFRQAMERFQRQAQQELIARMKAEGEKNQREGKEFLENNKEREGVVTLKSGLQYEVVESGTGPSPKRTDRVRTHYRGTLISGKEFDSSYKTGEPAVFQVDEVISGWTEALLRMKVGDKWKLYIPAHLAYAETGSPPDIGPHAVLIFEIQLLGIE
jgi:FKBP-type peptidyl-prolyl cis-trans isomerase